MRMSGRHTLVVLLLLFAGTPWQPASAQEKPAVPDTLEQRLKACAACHGDQGEGMVNKNEYYPRLAGKPAVYLYNQLLNFRDKRRESGIMNYLVAFLSDGYLFEIANYYAELQPPFPAPSRRAPAADIALGGKLVRQGDPARDLPACIACHGEALTGLQPAIPGLLGLYPAYVNAQLGAWRNNRRHAMKPDCMHELAQKLTPKDIGAITAWLVAQPVPANPQPAAAGSLKLPLECGGLSTRPSK
jgi:cytochrome c553